LKLNRKTLINILLLLFAVVVFVLIGIKTDWVKTTESLKSAKIEWVIASAVIMLSSHLVRAIRWNLLTEPAGYKLNHRRTFYAILAGYLVNVGTSRGGEVVRCALSAKSEKAPIELLIGTVVTERIIDLLMLLSVCLITLMVQFDLIFGFFDFYVFTPASNFFTFKNTIVLLVGAMVLFFGLKYWIKNRKSAKIEKEEKGGIVGIMAKFTGGLKTIFKLKSPSIFIFLSISIWVGYWLSGYCLMKSLDITEQLGLTHALGLLVFGAIGIAIPLPAGAGVWGTLSFGLATVYGLPAEQADTFGIYNVAFSNLFNILVGSLGYFLLWIEMQKLDKNAA